jgi:hypothetical protein
MYGSVDDRNGIERFAYLQHGINRQGTVGVEGESGSPVESESRLLNRNVVTSHRQFGEGIKTAIIRRDPNGNGSIEIGCVYGCAGD